MPKWLTTTLRLTAIIGVAAAASIVGLIAVRNMVDLETIHDSGDAIGSYLQVLGGIYAVLLAFVVVVVWQQFNDARGYVHREANAVLDLHRTSSGLPESAREVIQHGLRDYIAAVVADEWRAMSHGDQETIDKIGQRLDRVWSAIHTCMPTNDCQHTVYAVAGAGTGAGVSPPPVSTSSGTSSGHTVPRCSPSTMAA